MRALLLAISILVTSAWWAGAASADVGGETPGPGLCDYPMTGSAGMDFSVYHYECHGPIEINGSHWQAFYGGAAAQATVGVGLGISILNLNASISPTVGVLEGVVYWACPDLTMAEQPNPPGAWSTKITPVKCKTIAPKPAFLDRPPPESIGPPNPLAPPPPPPPPPPADDTPPVTDAPNTPNFPKAM